MADHPPRLAFFKLNVPDMAAALQFWRSAMGFAVTATYDEPDFLEHILSLPGQEEDGPHMMLVEWKAPTATQVGPGHGPVGFVVSDVAKALERALDAGATTLLPVTEVAPGLVIAKFASPQGHEAELVHQGKAD